MRTPLPHGSPGTWKWLRVYYNSHCKDLLIVDGIYPLPIQTVQEESSALSTYFLRDWVGGPHVLVGICETEDRSSVIPLVKSRIQTFLDAHPSPAGIDGGEYKFRQRYLGAAEARLVEGDAAMVPNNSIVENCAEPVATVQRTPQLQIAVRRWLCQTAPISVSYLKDVRSRGARKERILLQLLITLAWTGDPDRLRTHMSFRSHADGFLRGYDRQKRLQYLLEFRYEEQRDIFRTLLTTTLQELTLGQPSLGGMPELGALMKATLHDLCEGVHQGVYGTSPSRKVMDVIGTAFLAMNPEAEVLQMDGELQSILSLRDGSCELQGWQLLVNFVYLTINQLGLTPLQRFTGCYMASRMIEEYTGRSARSIFLELVRSMDPRAMLSIGSY